MTQGTIAVATAHQGCLEWAVDEEFRGEPGRREAYGLWLRSMRSGEYGQEAVDVIVQKTVHSYDIYDAYVFAYVVMAMTQGDLVWLQVPVKGTPAPDREADRNNRTLGTLSSEFQAEVHSGIDHNGDGWFENKNASIFLHKQTPEKAFILPPTTFALEVGTTRASRTYLHLMEERCLARWPYGSESIHLLYRLDRRPLP